MAAHFARENAKALGGWCRGSNANDGNQTPSGVTKNHQAIEQLERDRPPMKRSMDAMPAV
jgi:hypothetical protein